MHDEPDTPPRLARTAPDSHSIDLRTRTRRAAGDRTVVDGDGRTLAVGPVDPIRDRRGLRRMYADFDSAGRTRGVPPAAPDQLDDWLDALLEGSGYVAFDDRPVGHAALLFGDDGPAELAVFVAASHRDAGVGTELLRSLLDTARGRNAPIRLSVKRHNRAAVSLYRSFGFEVIGRDRCEMAMERPPNGGE